MDVTREEDWARVVADAAKKWGRLDVLVNNAGTSYRNKVNLCSPYDMLRALHQIKKKLGLQWRSEQC